MLGTQENTGSVLHHWLPEHVNLTISIIKGIAVIKTKTKSALTMIESVQERLEMKFGELNDCPNAYRNSATNTINNKKNMTNPAQSSTSNHIPQFKNLHFPKIFVFYMYLVHSQ